MRGALLLLLSLLLLFATAAEALEDKGDAVVVELVPCNDTHWSGICLYHNVEEPEGILQKDEWEYFQMDLSGLEYGRKDPLVVPYSFLSLGGSIEWLLRKDSLPTEDDHEGTSHFSCSSGSFFQNCTKLGHDYSQDTAGVCNAAKTTWYLGVHNTGPTSLLYRMEVMILSEANAIPQADRFEDGCNADLWRELLALWIALLSVGIFFCCVLPVAAISWCCYRFIQTDDYYIYKPYKQIP